MMRFRSLFKKLLNVKSEKFANNFGKYALVMPLKVSTRNIVPSHIPKPLYHETGVPDEPLEYPEVKNMDQIEGMRKSCKLAAKVLRTVGEQIRVGQTTDEIDRIVHNLTINAGAYPSPLNYRHFPKSVCTSVNNVACHGIPDSRSLEDGDIVNVDVTVYFEGYHGDCSKTFLVGNVDQLGRDLVKATEECLHVGIRVCKPGAHFAKIGFHIEEEARKMGYTVVPAFIGHGIGYYFHGPPDIMHMRNSYPGIMEPGMTFTIEPILTQGTEYIEILEDNWTAITEDGARTAQFEHTILITPSGVEVLTEP